MTTAKLPMFDYISSHPAIALTVGLAHLGFAEILYKLEVPLFVMQVFQMGAWSVTIIVGLVTLHGWIKKRKK